MNPIRTLAAGALSAGLVLAAGPAFASGHLTEPEVTTDGSTRTIEVRSVTTDEGFIPKGGQPAEEEPDDEPVPGDAFTFTSDYFQGDARVGSDEGKCTFTSFDTVECDVTVTFPGGTIRIKDSVTFDMEADEDTPFTVDLVSGTGDYAGIEGTVRVVGVDEETDDLTFSFTLPDGDQVEAVPVGGADTGGGAGDASTTDAAVLVGLGLAVLAGGAGLFGAARVSARRG